VIESFLSFFSILKQSCKNDPNKLSGFFGESKEIRNAANMFYNFLVTSSFKENLHNNRKKYISRAPLIFKDEYAIFKKYWETPLIDCMFKEKIEERKKKLEAESNLFSSVFHLLHLPCGTTYDVSAESICDNFSSEIDYFFEEHFDPQRHNGGTAIIDFMSSLDQFLATGDGFDTPMDENNAQIALDALAYFENSIGINFQDTFDRWNKVPITYFPQHVSNEHFSPELGSLFDLLDDAIRSYVAGAPAASISMCRAILEMVLKKHYDIDIYFQDRNGSRRDKGLGQLIILASEKYDFIQKSKIDLLSKTANKILHDYSMGKKFNSENDEVIISFLKTVKFVIERAPH
jgi:hypothetical protein